MNEAIQTQFNYIAEYLKSNDWKEGNEGGAFLTHTEVIF